MAGQQMITKSPTFCPAPWSSLNIDQAGETNAYFQCVKMVRNNKKKTNNFVELWPTLAKGIQ